MKRGHEYAALIVILLIAAFARFTHLGVNSFAGDEARISLDALRMTREFVMAGQASSVGIPFFPASVWLYTPPFVITPDPLLATAYTGALNLLMIIGVWWLGRQFTPTAGLIAALVLATQPFAVFYARNIWQPNLLAPLATLWGIAAYLGATKTGRTRAVGIALCVFIGGLTVQVHFAGAALILGTAYMFVRWRWWRDLIPVLIGGALAFAATIPYLIYITTIAPEVLQNFGATVGGESRFSLSGLDNLLRLALAWDWGFLAWGEGDPFGQNVLISVVIGVLLLIGVLGLVVQWRARATHESSLHVRRALIEILIVWLVMSPLFFLRHSTPVLIHYQLVALPAVALIIGVGAVAFPLRIRSGVRGGVVVGLVALTALWLTQIVQTLDYVSVNRPVNSALSSIIRESRTAAYSVETPILFFTHGDDPALDGEVAVFNALLWGRDHRVINGTTLLILPPHPATIMMTLAPFQAWEELEAADLTGAYVEYPRRVGALPFIAARYDGVTPPAGFDLLDEPIPFADGTTLTGYRARYVGDRFRISTLWDVTADASPNTYQMFHHLRWNADGAGDPAAISDVALSRHTWRVGDRVIVMADYFDIPNTLMPITAEIGHYTLPDLVRVPRTDDPPARFRESVLLNVR